MLPFISLTVIATIALLLAEWRGSRAGVWIAKPLASLGFVLAAFTGGALESAYGTGVLVALLLCLLGDVLLIPKQSTRIFQAGVLSFLLGHLAFAVAFASLGLDQLACAGAAVPALVALILVLRWLRPHLRGGMRIAVYAYTAVISAMVIFAAGATAAGAPITVLIGALMFYLSDLSVARDRFVAPGLSNGLWGLPLYFGGQLVLASTVS
jgi:uncharacterized membrane protein YhhN